MILSIGMIVRNEEKYLRRCLEAIQPILKQVESELIIADTGSTDNTVKIAKEFTNHVFSFKWCNNFSAARNATLRKAVGKWFMALDADEIFEDTSDLIRFFNSEEYKNFNSATFISRSPNKVGSKIYSDFNVLRLTKNTKEICYTGAIHESFNIIQQPIKFLPVIAYHYGYITFENEDFIKQKTERNMEIILHELKKDPYNCRNYDHIYQAYFMYGKYEQALEYCKTGLHYAKKQNSMMQYVFYMNMTVCYYFLKRYSDAIETINQYFAFRKKPLAFDLEMYCLQGHANFDSENFKDAIGSFENYITFYEEYKNGLHHGTEMLFYSGNSAREMSFRDAIFKLATAYMNEHDYLAAGRCTHMISITDWLSDSAYVSRRLILEISLMNNTMDFSGLPLLYVQLDAQTTDLLQNMIEKDIENERYRNLIFFEFAKADIQQTDYTKLMNLRFQYNCGNLSANIVDNFISGIDKWKPLYADAVYFALSVNCKINLIVSKIDPYELNTMLFSSVYLHFNDLPQIIYKISLNQQYDADSQLTLSFLYLWALTSGKLQKGQILSLFYTYSKSVYAYLELNIMNQSIDKMPQMLRFGYYCYNAASAPEIIQKGRYLIEAAKIYPPFVNAAKLLLSELNRESKETCNMPNLSEFEKYAIKIKKNIIRLFEEGKMSEAGEILNSYEQLNPNDTEIISLKEKLI